MSRINFNPLLTFPDGSHLVISTQCSVGGDFSCALYSAVVETDDHAALQVISNHFAASTCLSAQEYTYSHTLRLYAAPVNDEKTTVPHLAKALGSLLPSQEFVYLWFKRTSKSRAPMLSISAGTDILFLFPANLDCRFDLTIFWTDHQQHPLVLRSSLKQRGIIIVLAFLDRGIAAFAIV